MREFPLGLTRRLASILPRRLPRYRVAVPQTKRPKVLVTGVYVGNKPTLIEHIVNQLSHSRLVDIEQRWAVIAGAPPSSAVAAMTVMHHDAYTPKWPLLEELVRTAPEQDFDYVVFCDDDVWLGDGFLDALIGLQRLHDFALAQPARTWRSFTDWPIVRRRLGSTARQTNFVESGPVVSMRRDFFALATPFSADSPMGWGYDLVWPKLAERNGMIIGIIDAVPVDHSFRPRSELYSYTTEIDRMSAYLAKRDHIRGLATYHVIR